MHFFVKSIYHSKENLIAEHLSIFLWFQRGEMTSFAVLAKEDIDLELSPDEVEELENCSSEYVKENQSFANLLKNLFSGGGRERKSKIEGK